ncbi:MAG: ATP-binding protein [Candidatus Thermoplasmatota archaeon]|nr:ATP-binding protein [Candidatus Thermoplasmatota archaeon]
MLLKFIDRQKELEVLENAYKSNKPDFIIIYGRRRLGKTELVKKFIKDKQAFYFLAKQENLELELERFKEKIAKKFNIFIEADNLEKLFEEIGKKIKGRTIIVIDEFPYWVLRDEKIISEFQYLWDEILSKQNRILILLGSYMSIMEQKVIGYKSPLYGRRTAQIEIKPFRVTDIKGFLPKYKIQDIIRTYGAADTIPYYLIQFDKNKTFWKNLRNTFLNTSNPLYQDAEILLSTELREYNTYFNIIKAIIDGSTKLSEIANKSRVDITNISKYLKVLTGLKIIRKIKPITASPKEKNYLYELKDNYFRFWLTYVYPYKEEIEENPDEHLRFIMKNYPHYMGKIFEDFTTKILRQMINIKFSKTGKWWYKNREIDIVGLNEPNRNIIFGECKWQDNINAEKIFEELKEKAEFVDWNKNKRKEHYAIFAKSFKKRAKGCYCFDLKDISKKIF